MTAKSFGKPVELEDELLEAIATYTARAAEKLRKQESAATSINVFFSTNAFKEDTPQYNNNLTRVLPFPTSFTPDLLTVAREMIHSIYRKGYAFRKCGVFLSKIVPQEVMQADLLESIPSREYGRCARNDDHLATPYAEERSWLSGSRMCHLFLVKGFVELKIFRRLLAAESVLSQ